MKTPLVSLRLARAVLLSTALSMAGCMPRPLPPPEAPPWRGGGAYEPRSMTRFGGEVVSVDDVRATDAAFSGMHVLIRAEKGTLSVHLGPKRFFDERDFAIMPGDVLEGTGLLTDYQGSPALLATTVKKGGTELTLPHRTDSFENK
jgi:hypothetical protein